MYTIVDRKTLIVFATGLTREQATANLKEYMFLHTDSYKNAPKVHCSKLNKETMRFDDITFEEIKAIRTKLLNDSDWRDLPSYPLTDQEEWKAYRKALRDIPENFSSPQDVIFPTPPL